MKQLIMEGAVINDFSYPFLRLLTDRLKELRDKGELFDDKGHLPDEVVTIIHHIDNLLPSGSSSPSKYSAEEKMLPFIENADAFLAIFEPTEEEQLEAARGCEQ